MPYGRYGYGYQEPISPLGAFMGGLGSGFGTGIDIFLRRQQREQLAKEKETLENKAKINQIVQMFIEGDPTAIVWTQTKEGRNWLREVGADKHPIIANILEETTPQPSAAPMQLPSQMQAPPTGVPGSAIGTAYPQFGPGGLPGPQIPGPAVSLPPAGEGKVDWRDVIGVMPSMLDIAPQIRQQKVKETLGIFRKQKEIEAAIKAAIEKDETLSPTEQAIITRNAINAAMAKYGSFILDGTLKSLDVRVSGKGEVSMSPQFVTGWDIEGRREIERKAELAEQKAETTRIDTKRTQFNSLIEEAKKFQGQAFTSLNNLAKTGSSSELVSMGLMEDSAGNIIPRRERLKMLVDIKNNSIRDYNRRIMETAADPDINMDENEARNHMIPLFGIGQFMEKIEEDETKLPGLDNKIVTKKKELETKPSSVTKKAVDIEEMPDGKYLIFEDGSRAIIQTDDKGDYVIINNMKHRIKIEG